MVSGRKYSAAMHVPTTTGPVAPSADSRAKPAIQEPTAVPRLNEDVLRAEASVGAAVRIEIMEAT